VQVMLLRVLETGELYPVGDRTPVTVDVRLVAATDAQLEQQIQEGRFKAPLLHRLAGYSIRVPPLRERREDIGLLFHHFARAELAALGEAWRLKPDEALAEPWLPPALAARLVGHRWSGNIRELRNVARQLVIGNRGQPSLRLDAQLEQELSLSRVPPPGRPASAPPPAEAPATPRRKPSEISEAELLAALRENDWDFQAAADQLRIHRSSIYDLIDKSPNLRTAGDLSPEEITRCFHECGGDLDAMTRRLQVSKRALGRRVKELGLA
ncbi:sigma 54-interacting transcriptional regulator, partial [Pyxidicoccus sp. 3LFB2]